MVGRRTNWVGGANWVWELAEGEVQGMGLGACELGLGCVYE